MRTLKPKALAKLVLLLVLILSGFALYQLPNLKFIYDFEAFFPENDKDLEFFYDYREKYSHDTDFILVALSDHKSVFDKAFLQKASDFTDSLKELQYVTEVLSPTNAKFYVKGPIGPIGVKYLHYQRPDLYKTDSVRIFKSEQLVGSLFSTNGKGLSIVINSESEMNKKESDVLANGLKRVIKRFDFKEVHYAGRMTGQLYYIEKLQSELAVFILVSLLILVVVLWLFFRSIWGVWVPLLIVVLTGIMLLAFMSLTNKPIDLMTAILPTILFVVGISDVVHIISKYLEERRIRTPKLDAIKITFKEIGIATFLTSFTTAVGFLTLLTVRITPLKEFGVYTSIGVFIAFVLAFSILPAILVLTKNTKQTNKKPQTIFWNRLLQAWFIKVLRNQKSIMIVSGIIIVISLIGVSKIEVNNYLLEDLSESDSMYKSFKFFEDNFAGVRPFEMNVSLADTNKEILSYANLKKLDKIDSYLHDQYQVGFLISPLSFVKSANQAFNGGKIEYYSLPATISEYDKLKPFINRIGKSEKGTAYYSSNKWECRFSGKIADVGAIAIAKKNTKFDKFITNQIGSSINTKLTGTALLIDKNNEYLAYDMVSGLIIAFLVIGVLMGILFKSIRMLVLSFFPNVIPLIMVGGLMGFTGIDLKISTALIFTIAFGIAVDDTIHFMSKLRIELGKGKSLLYAIKRTFLSTGKAIMVTSLILYAGFFSLAFSSFGSTFYVGVLVSTTLLFALIGDLFLLPVLLLWFYKPKKT